MTANAALKLNTEYASDTCHKQVKSGQRKVIRMVNSASREIELKIICSIYKDRTFISVNQIVMTTISICCDDSKKHRDTTVLKA